MTLEAEEMAAVQHGLDNLPRPAMDRLPKGSAVRRLAEVLGRPNLAVRVSELCGQHVSVVLAQAVDAAVVRRTTEIENEVEARLTAEFAARFAAELDQAHAAIVGRWSVDDRADQYAEIAQQQEIEDAVRRGAESAVGTAVADFVAAQEQPEVDCVAPEPWATRVDLHLPPAVLAGVFTRAADEDAEQARVSRFMAGGNDV